jgi:predicted AAA+ superfamily ATPase
MAHLRARFVESHIREALSFSPLVGVLGLRQVGKTTLAEMICKNYRSFDDADQLSSAIDGPVEYLKQFKSLTALDECQKRLRCFQH